MLGALAVALSLTSSPALDVPFVPQTEALCGGAAAAMVFRYWGDAHADAQQFAPLIERRPGGVAGIANDVLLEAVRSRGWLTDRIDPSTNPLDGLLARLDARNPVIVLLADRRDLYHYVVVTGATSGGIVLHDPSWGPSRRLKTVEFQRLWAASGYWSLVIRPSEPRPTSESNGIKSDGTTASKPSDPCEEALDAAVKEIRARGVDTADIVLEPVLRRCPDAAGPIRELAGVRFLQHRWHDASTYAQRALQRNPYDEYALSLLGASLFMEDDAMGALRAWNRIGRPRLDLVRIEGLHHSRYQTIADALELKPTDVLTVERFLRARRRLEDLPDRSSSRISVRPLEDGTASVDVAIAERAGLPRGLTAWSAAAVRAAVDREASVALPGFNGQGEVWSASWRWWSNRPRVAVSLAAPRVAGLFGVWTVEGSWEAETYGATDRSGRQRTERTHGGLTVSDWLTGGVRYSISGGFDAWNDGRRAAAAGASMERRWFGDRVTVAGDVTAWFPLRDRSDGGRFTSAGAHAVVRSAQAARDWVSQGTVGTIRVSDTAPLTIWPGAGEGRARPQLLRAHPILDDGVIDVNQDSTFGRSIYFGSAEIQRWLPRPALVRVGAAAFVDVARATRRVSSVDGPAQVDVGGGLRIRVPGTPRVLRVDAAHGLRDGSNAVTIGWTF